MRIRENSTWYCRFSGTNIFLDLKLKIKDSSKNKNGFSKSHLPKEKHTSIIVTLNYLIVKDININ